MKLINKISYNFIIFSFFILILFSLAVYFIIEQTIVNEADEQLLKTYQEVAKEVIAGKEINFKPFIELKEVSDSTIALGFQNIIIKSKVEENEFEPFREYSANININGKKHLLIVRSSIIEKDEMLFSIILATIIMFFIFLLVLIFINKFTSQKVLRDFYETLDRLEDFSIADSQPLYLGNSNIEEFNKLNEVINNLSEKALKEYKNLKEFTEETNHEIQTPIAVIKAKLDILLQNERFNENEINAFKVVLSNLNRLERINKSLLFLNKLDNDFSYKSSEHNLETEIDNILDSLSESISEKNISISKKYNYKITLTINSTLLNVLLNNLISNSIKHNYTNGSIEIKIDKESFTISNSGMPLKEKPDKMFERFKKGSNIAESTGLGLTIVKRICNYYDYKVTYSYNELHQITIKF